MKELEKASAYCPHCDSKLTLDISQPYQDYTYRIEFICKQYAECLHAGIVMLMEVKQ